MIAIRWKRVLQCGCIVFVIGAVVVLLRSAVHKVRDDANAAACQGKFSQLAVAFDHFRERFGSYPPAYITDELGQPAHSWRIFIISYIEMDDVFLKYDFGEPWNGPSNE